MSRGGPTVLVVDDEPGVREALRTALELEGFRVSTAPDGLGAVRQVGGGGVDAVVLDVAMPLVDGLEACRRVRAAGSRVPILMLTARDASTTGSPAWRPGPTTTCPSPSRCASWSPACGRSCAAPPPRSTGDDDGILRYADLRLDRHAHLVWRGERPVALTRTEFLLLETFMEHPGQVLERAQILLRRLGLRLRRRVQLAGRLRRLPAPQARGGRRAAPASRPCARWATSCAPSRELPPPA